MKDTMTHSELEGRFARRVTSRLDEASADLPHDIGERLRFARLQASQRHRALAGRTAHEVDIQRDGAATLRGGERSSVWGWLASLVPLIALVVGMALIATLQEQRRVDELAEVDAELLTDELPPAAYTDPGFLKFLTTRREE